MFGDRGIIVGAICVGFVHHCFYEVFDQLGPQLRWWAWNTDNKINYPMLASVPMSSVYIFATLGPIAVTVLVMLLVGRKANNARMFTGAGLAWRTVAAGALVPIGVALLSIPSSLFGGDKPNVTAQAVVFSVELVIVAGVAVPVLVSQWSELLHTGDDVSRRPNEFVRLFGTVYLVVLAALWASALPEYFAAVRGVTADGTPVGSLVYAAASFAFAALAIVSVAVTSKTRHSTMAPVVERH